jgi:hypothetical protein
LLYLITRPFAWLLKLLTTIVKSPFKLMASIRDRRARKNAKFAAKAIRGQQKEAKAADKAA